MVLGSTGSGLKLRSFSSFVPWKSPQSTSSFLPAPPEPPASTKYFDPVTHPAAPKNVSFAIALPFYRFPVAQAFLPVRFSPAPSTPAKPPAPSFRTERADFSSHFAPAKWSARAERNLSSFFSLPHQLGRTVPQCQNSRPWSVLSTSISWPANPASSTSASQVNCAIV